jgi:hypothetical protein
LEPAQDTAPPPRIRAAVVAELQRQHGRSLSTRDRITILRERSHVVPNLVYYWGVFAPPHTSHVSRVAVVAVGDNRHLPVRTLEDWHSLASGVWRASTDSAVVEGCAEAVRITGSERFPGAMYHVVHRPMEVLHLPIPEPQGVSTAVQPPVVIRTGTETTADFWLVQTGDVVRYRCALSSQRTQVDVLRKLPGAGFLSPN